MAKRKEVILQETLNSQESWEEAMNKEKLYVVDAHQKWCGPCVAIVGMLKRIKNELGDDLLKFATAEVDSIDSLERYRGKCEPNFLFYASGHLVASVRGCNAPLIQSTIESSLVAEHKVLNGEAERKVISDAVAVTPEVESEGEEEFVEETLVPKKFTVALIKPDVVANGQTDEIIAKIEESGIEILANDERMLSEEEASNFYKDKSEEEFFKELITYVTSGPCRVLVLTKGETGEGVVELWRDIIGPFDAAVAKEEKPNSLRSIYGENATRNAVHGSTSEEDAVRELGFFYPNFDLPTCTRKRHKSSLSSKSQKTPTAQDRVERTLALIRPDALRQHREAILQKIDEAGFKIAIQKEVTLTREQVEDFYSELKGSDIFEPLVKQMTCGPVLALCLASDDAIGRWRKMLGPKDLAEAEQQPDSLRAQFKIDESQINMLHGSDSPEVAELELSKLFHLEQTVAVIKPDAVSEKEKIIDKLREAGFMISCQKDLRLSKEIAGEMYKAKKGAEFYDQLVNHMTSGNTLFMVLSAENAVSKLRQLMGPPDPEEAKTNYPNSLRAAFAKTMIENAIHAPSNEEDAKDDIKRIFGDLHFSWDGIVTPVHGDELGKKEDEETLPEEGAGAKQQEGVKEGGEEGATTAAEKQEVKEGSEDVAKEEKEASGEMEEEDRTETISSDNENIVQEKQKVERSETDEKAKQESDENNIESDEKHDTSSRDESGDDVDNVKNTDKEDQEVAKNPEEEEVKEQEETENKVDIPQVQETAGDFDNIEAEIKIKEKDNISAGDVEQSTYNKNVRISYQTSDDIMVSEGNHMDVVDERRTNKDDDDDVSVGDKRSSSSSSNSIDSELEKDDNGKSSAPAETAEDQQAPEQEQAEEQETIQAQEKDNASS